MPDQVASLLPSGAGRFQDFIWPSPLQMLGNGVGASFISRIGGGATMPGAVVIFGAGAAATVFAIGGGVMQQIPTDVANAGSQRLFYPGFPVMLRTSRTPIDGTVDDCAVYRFVIVMGATASIGAGGEQGFQITQYNAGGGQRIVADASPGIAIDLANGLGSPRVIVRGPNGLQTQDLSPTTAAFLSTYDIRLFSATAKADAFWTLRINGQVQPLLAINSSWGAPGTNLPPAASSGGAVGFTPSLVASAQATSALFVRSCQLIAAPTELMTL